MNTRAIVILALLGFCAVLYYDPSLLSFSTGANSVTGTSQLSPDQLNNVLCTAHSPACGTGQSLYDAAKKYQINDAYALATFKKESSYGLAGVARVTHSLGNIRCTAGYACYQGYRSYPSWQAGYSDFYSLIRNLYVNQWHLSTVQAIIPRYAPSTENDTQKYISDVNTAMSSYGK